MALITVTGLFVSSCNDISGEYVEQLYTDSQKEKAVKACLTTSADSALNHIFKYDGFYGNEAYRIDFAPLRSSLFDTLDKHGAGFMTDSLILKVNRLAEGCGQQLAPYVKKAIDTLVVIDPEYLLKGHSTAITDYFKLNQSQFLKSSFQTPVAIRMNLLGINSLWSSMHQEYNKYATNPLNFDIQNYVIERMLDGIYAEMGIEEALIRQDTSHRDADTKLFSNYD